MVMRRSWESSFYTSSTYLKHSLLIGKNKQSQVLDISGTTSAAIPSALTSTRVNELTVRQNKKEKSCWRKSHLSSCAQHSASPRNGFSPKHFYAHRLVNLLPIPSRAALQIINERSRHATTSSVPRLRRRRRSFFDGGERAMNSTALRVNNIDKRKKKRRLVSFKVTPAHIDPTFFGPFNYRRQKRKCGRYGAAGLRGRDYYGRHSLARIYAETTRNKRNKQRPALSNRRAKREQAKQHTSRA